MKESEDEDDDPPGSKNGNRGSHPGEKGLERFTDFRVPRFTGAANRVDGRSGGFFAH